ncbi:MAG TPA: hypothetical protein DCY13_25120 [Verrucomicrobiales bacterium]|nr:hypothetical protein [Verrucomicrobiales bacterium]
MSDVANQAFSDYRSSRTEAAFATLVEQHIDLVYSAARRIVAGDTHLAEDVTQTVFADLARKAPRLPADVILSAWLYRHTFFVASSMIRSEQRRRRREQESLAMNIAKESADPDWSALADHLDDAMNKLSETDRQALILRFFERLEFRVVGARIGVGEGAAQKRVSRAVDKLRQLFTRQGINISSTSLGGLLLAHAVAAAPTALANKTAAAVIAGSAAGTGFLFTLQQFLSMNLIKPLATTALLAGLSVPLFLQHQSLAALSEENAGLAEQAAELDKLRKANERLSGLAANQAELDALRKDQLELARLRNDHTRLTRLLAEMQSEVARQRKLLAAQAAALEKTLTEEQRQARRQVTIESKIAEVRVDSPVWREFGLQPPSATDRAGASYLLGNDTVQRLIERLEELEGVDIMFAPRLITANGRQAQIKTVDVRNIVTGKRGQQLVTEPMEFGPVIDLIPTMAPDSELLQINATATIREFLGYDDPGHAVATLEDGSRIAVAPAETPLRRIRSREMKAETSLAPGQTLVLAGGFAESRVPSSESATGGQVTRKGLIVMISPEEVDPAGNAVGQNSDFPPASAQAAETSARARR